MVADFADVYGIRLHRMTGADLGWREFLNLLVGLLCSDTRVWRFFNSENEPVPAPEPAFDA